MSQILLFKRQKFLNLIKIIMILVQINNFKIKINFNNNNKTLWKIKKMINP